MKNTIWSHLFGLLLISLGVVAIIFSKVGAGPVDAFNYFVYKLTPDYITLGTIAITTGVVVTLIVFLIERKKDIIISFGFLFLIGVFIDLWKLVFDQIPEVFLISYFVRIPIAVISLIVVSFGVALTLVSGYPITPFDRLLMIINRKVRNIQYSKMILEGSFFIMAVILGLISGRLLEQVNIFTFMIVLTVGKIIAVFVHMLEKKEKKEVTYDTQ